MQTIVNLGTGGADLNGQNGSTTSADSNDALFLDWPGDNAGNYVYLPGVTDNYLSVPDEAALDITGDIDIRVQVAMDDWTPGTNYDLIGKWGASGNRSFFFRLQDDGDLSLTWTSDGSSATQDRSTDGVSAADGAVLWVRVTLDVDNGSSEHETKFYTSDDGSTWTQLGTTITNSGTTSIYAGTSEVQIGTRGDNTNHSAGKFYRAQILDGIGGTTVLDVDTSVITSGSATSFTATTGQTVTIDRGTSGRKSVAVVSPVWLFGTDDYMEVGDNALLDFDASDSFSAVIVIRLWDDVAGSGRMFAKASGNDSTTGYQMRTATAGTYRAVSRVYDGTDGANATLDYGAAGNLVAYSMVVDRSTDTIIGYGDTTTATGNISNVDSVSNDSPLRIGARVDDANYQDFEVIGFSLFRRVLTASEIAAIVTYYQNRLS